MTLFLALVTLAAHSRLMWLVIAECIAVLFCGWQFGGRPALAMIAAPYRRSGRHGRATAESQAAGLAHLAAIGREQQAGYAEALTEEIPATPPTEARNA